MQTNNTDIELFNLLYDLEAPTFKDYIALSILYYTSNPNYIIKKYINNDKLEGVLIYFEDATTRYIEYILCQSTSNYLALKIYRDAQKTKKSLQFKILKTKTKLINIYIKHGFKMIDETLTHFTLKR